MNENISNHITYAEGVVSATGKRLGIDNTPTPEILETMKNTSSKLFEPIREKWDHPIEIISFYRCPELNKAVGGSKTSGHPKGEAIDARATGDKTNAQLFHFIMGIEDPSIEFDQIILEFPEDGEPSWLHISYKANGGNRMQVLVAVKQKGKTVYLLYKDNKELINPSE